MSNKFSSTDDTAPGSGAPPQLASRPARDESPRTPAAWRSAPAPVAAPSRRRPPALDPYGGLEHREYPRARLGVRFELWIGEGEERRFSASLQSRNVSVSGAFVESTFFLPVGTEVAVRFRLDAETEPVTARAIIVREERPGDGGEAPTGMGLHFVEFFNQSQVTLARLFLGERLRAFAQEYLQSPRAASMGSELDRVIDALAAWELAKTTGEDDPWQLKGTV